jgi:hypothetical protein
MLYCKWKQIKMFSHLQKVPKLETRHRYYGGVFFFEKRKKEYGWKNEHILSDLRTESG